MATKSEKSKLPKSTLFDLDDLHEAGLNNGEYDDNKFIEIIKKLNDEGYPVGEYLCDGNKDKYNIFIEIIKKLNDDYFVGEYLHSINKEKKLIEDIKKEP
jgi:hypothetical protein